MRENQTYWFIDVWNQMWRYLHYLYKLYIFKNSIIQLDPTEEKKIKKWWCFGCVGGFHLQCNRNDPSHHGQVCVPRLGTGHRMAHGSLLYAAHSWIHHLHVLQHQGKHSSGKTALSSDWPYNINVFVQGVDMLVLCTQKCCLSSAALAQNDKAHWGSQAKRGQPFNTTTLPSRNNGWSLCLMLTKTEGTREKCTLSV